MHTGTPHEAPRSEPRLLRELQSARSHIAALEQLLEVHEQTALDHAVRLEETLTSRSQALARESAARQALAERETQLRLALDAGQMGTWEWNIAEERLHWSPELERLFAFAPGEFGGTMQEYAERLHPEDREAALHQLQETLREGKRAHHMLHRIVRLDGEVRWLETHGRVSYAEDRRALRFVGVSTDVTEQRRLERALAFERTRLQDVLMQAPAAISVTEGREHVIVMQNLISRQIVGGRDLVGRRVQDVFPELEAQGLVALQDQVFESGEPYSANELHVRFDRHGRGELSEGYFNVVYQPLRNAEGAVYGILAFSVEVTEQVHSRLLVERKAHELEVLSRELERSNQDLDQFAYVASHDLKAPLRGIANLAQWIEEDIGDRLTSDSREHLRLLRGRVNRMESLINGILEYSRAGRKREGVERIDVRDMLLEVVELLSPPADVAIEIGDGMPVFDSERVPLQQVFMNLLGNAVKHAAPDGGEIRVSARPIDDGYEFAVADNGPGIAPQFQERIWQIFQTLAPRDKVEGTGIGLSVVRKTVEARGGRVWVESAEGAGATFFFSWPTGPRTG